MSSDDMSQTASTCRSIVSVAHTISSVAGLRAAPLPSDPSCLTIPVTEYRLPTPPPIECLLLSLGSHAALSARLSSMYEASASQFRASSESNLRRTILACKQVNHQFGLSSYDPTSLRTAAIEVYVRAVERLAFMAISLLQQHLQRSARPLTSSEIRSSIWLSTSLNRRSPSILLDHEGCLFANNHSETNTLRQSITESLSYAKPSFSSLSDKIGASSVIGLGAEDDGDVWKDVPVYKCFSPKEDENIASESQIRSGCVSCAFPTRYSHRRKASSCTLPSSSQAFSCNTRTKIRSEAILTDPTANSVPVDLLASFGKLSVGSSSTEVVHISSASTAATRHTRISTQSPRKLASLPRRTVVSSPQDIKPPFSFEPQPSLSAAQESTSLSSSTSFQYAVPPSLFDTRHTKHGAFTQRRPADGSISLIPQSGGRQRKVAPLPNRRPTVTHLHDTSSTSVSNMVGEKPEPVLPSRRMRITPTIPRTPSLVSLSSSRSTSPGLTDEGPATPPATPQISLPILPTASADTVPYSLLALKSHSPSKELQMVAMLKQEEEPSPLSGLCGWRR